MPDFDNGEPGKALPDKKNPVLNRISHVVILPAEGEGWRKKTDDTANFDKIGSTCLDQLIQDSATAVNPMAAPGMGMGGQPMVPEGRQQGGAGTGREGWAPANGSSGGIASGRKGEAGGAPGSGRGRGFGNPAATGTESTDKNAPTRTEFVIVFIWRESTPSDKLRGLDQPPTDASAAGTGAVPGQQAPMQPPGR